MARQDEIGKVANGALVKSQDDSFGTFFNLLSGYRLAQVMMLIGQSRIMEFVGESGNAILNVIERLGGSKDGGHRFVDCLVSLGFLLRNDNTIFCSPFSLRFLCIKSSNSQLRTLEFEAKLWKNWESLETAVRTGTRVPAPVKSNAEYAAHLGLFLDAMDEAARVRSCELWDSFVPASSGCICEVGAGSGAYLAEFLERNPNWQGIFVDLDDVVSCARQHPRMKALGERITYHCCNVLDENAVLPDDRIDVLLLSNFVHCQGEVPIRGLFRRLSPLLDKNGLLIVHDFFADQSWQGALYDWHMLVNTVSGRTYRVAQIEQWLTPLGFAHWQVISLPSFSTAVFASGSKQALP